MILLTLQNNGLGDFPAGDAEAPDHARNPDEYYAWEELDQAVFQFIYTSIRSDRLMQIPGGTIDTSNGKKPRLTSAQFWNNVCRKHETFSSQALNNLIRTLKKKDADLLRRIGQT